MTQLFQNERCRIEYSGTIIDSVSRYRILPSAHAMATTTVLHSTVRQPHSV